jgi:hypothetical protein
MGVKEVREERFSESDLVAWLRSADAHVILSHVHQGNNHWNAQLVEAELRTQLSEHLGWPSGQQLQCPVFLQDKYSYLSQCPEISIPTLQVSFDGDMIPEILQFTELHSEGNGWIVKLPFCTNGEGMAFCKTEGDIIDAIERRKQEFGHRFSYALLQPCLKNRKEYKVVLLNRRALFVADISQRTRLGTNFSAPPHDALKELAERACQLLETRCAGAITEPILRVDIMETLNGLVVNEFESLEACYYSKKFEENELCVRDKLRLFWSTIVQELTIDALAAMGNIR